VRAHGPFVAIQWDVVFFFFFFTPIASFAIVVPETAL